MKYRKTAAGLLACLWLAAVLTGCAPREEPAAEPRGKSYFTYFDTVSYVYDYAGDPAERFDELSAGASAVLEEYHRLFDIYHEYSGINNLCTVNRLAGGEPVEVDGKLIDFLLYAKELYQDTNGEMNVMLGAVLAIWHDCREAASADPASAQVPELSELQAAAEHTDIGLLEIDEEKGTVRLADPEASLDVGALGKGYAVERAADYLRQQGAESYVLNVGGNIRIIGAKPDGSGWTTGVKNPLDPDGEFALRLKLQDTACVTSGIYERYYTVDGQRYHHIIDKDTLFPSDHYASVTVVTPDSALADGLSTALFCMSYEEGLSLTESLGNVEVVWILPDGEIRSTPGMQALIMDE